MPCVGKALLDGAADMLLRLAVGDRHRAFVGLVLDRDRRSGNTASGWRPPPALISSAAFSRSCGGCGRAWIACAVPLPLRGGARGGVARRQALSWRTQRLSQPARNASTCRRETPRAASSPPRARTSPPHIRKNRRRSCPRRPGSAPRAPPCTSQTGLQTAIRAVSVCSGASPEIGGEQRASPASSSSDSTEK